MLGPDEALIAACVETRAHLRKHRALKHLPTGARAVMVGDRRYDVAGAQAPDMRTACPARAEHAVEPLP